MKDHQTEEKDNELKGTFIFENLTTAHQRYRDKRAHSSNVHQKQDLNVCTRHFVELHDVYVQGVIIA